VKTPLEIGAHATALAAGADLHSPLEPAAPLDDLVRRQVWGVLAAMYPEGRVIERRVDQRYPYPHLLYLTPVTANLTTVGESVVVVGKTLSERGLGVFHPRPLAQRLVIASLETGSEEFAGFLVDITWCRFTRYGWYESGGRFLEVTPSPIVRRSP
jgi:hypothetical protein